MPNGNSSNSGGLSSGTTNVILVVIAIVSVIIYLILQWIFVFAPVARTEALIEDTTRDVEIATSQVQDLVQTGNKIAQDLTDFEEAAIAIWIQYQPEINNVINAIEKLYCTYYPEDPICLVPASDGGINVSDPGISGRMSTSPEQKARMQRLQTILQQRKQQQTQQMQTQQMVNEQQQNTRRINNNQPQSQSSQPRTQFQSSHPYSSLSSSYRQGSSNRPSSSPRVQFNQSDHRY